LPGWDQFVEMVKQIGIFETVFVFFFFGAHKFLYQMYNGRLDDRQAEIDRLAQDNREYRERFLAITDHKFNYDSEKMKIKKPKRAK